MKVELCEQKQENSKVDKVTFHNAIAMETSSSKYNEMSYQIHPK